MIRVGILGASSQTGSSVALFLKRFPDIEVICLVRSSYSNVFFELTGLAYRQIDMRDAAGLRATIGDMDVVLDFGYPAGQLHEILSRSKENIAAVFDAMKKGSLYFYMSSIMAYGMPDGEKWVRSYRFPRTSYSYIKRAIEKFTFAQGKKHGIGVFNFRLGQVHGFLQSVNGSFRKKLSDSVIALVDGNADDPVNIIFIHPLCQGIVDCMTGKHKPGLYTLVAEPQWTLRDLYDYYLAYYDLPAHIEYHPRDGYHPRDDHRRHGGDRPPAAKKKRSGLLQRALRMAKPYRPLLETYVLMRFPALAVKLKGGFRRSELSSQRNSPIDAAGYIDFNLLGKPSVPTLPGLTTAPQQVMRIEKEMETYYNSLVFERYK